MALYKRPGSKFYWMKFTFKGQLYQQSTRLKNKREAENYEAAFRTGLQMETVGIRQNVNVPLLGDAVSEFLAWSRVELGASTQARYKFACDPLLKFFTAKRKTDTIDRQAFESYITWRRGQTSRKTNEPITADTINRELVMLKKVLRRLFDAGKIRSNPGAGFKLLPKNVPTFHVISKEEENLYLLACRPQLQDVATIMLATGMRPGEILGLAKTSVYTDRGFVQVEKGKTPAARRRVYMPEKCLNILEGE